jgi:hypothetical protein
MKFKRAYMIVTASGLLATGCTRDRAPQMTQQAAITEAQKLNKNNEAHGLCGRFIPVQNNARQWVVRPTDEGCNHSFGDFSSLNPGPKIERKQDRQINR